MYSTEANRNLGETILAIAITAWPDRSESECVSDQGKSCDEDDRSWIAGLSAIWAMLSLEVAATAAGVYGEGSIRAAD